MPAPKLYVRPKTLDEAVQQLQNPDSIALAGGGLLLGRMTVPYAAVVDLQDIPELRQIQFTPHHLRMGGAVTLQEVVESGDINPFLKRAITRTMPVNRRNGISVGESLSVNEPPAEWAAALAALDATLEYAVFSGQDHLNGMIVPVEEFTKARSDDRLPFRGIVIALHLPVMTGRMKTGAARVARTPADIPIVNAAAVVHLNADGTIQRLVVALTGVSAAPVLRLTLDALTGKVFDSSTIETVIGQMQPHIDPVADYRGSVEYRRAMAAVMVERALRECLGSHD